MDEKKKVIVICGPTASGKTSLSIELAKQAEGEIVSADSMQIYKDMTIGTAKPTLEEMQGVKHYLIDCISPSERYSVANYKKDAIDAIDTIFQENKVPIVVGGTGLYINSLIYGIDYNDIEVNLQYREELEKIALEKGLDYLYEEAEKIDSEATHKISRNDKKRIFRILEIYKATGKTKTEQEIESRKIGPKYEYILFGIQMNREILYDRINKRVDIMMQNGLVKEVQLLCEKYSQYPTAMQGLGYKEVVDFFNGNCTEEEMVDKIKQESRRYAKRQMTWFRRYENIIWLDGLDNIQNNINIILEEYNKR